MPGAPPFPGGQAPPERIRRIVHVDMDAFFASVEQRDNPDLRGKPVAVGGSSLRGVVAAASYEARPFGVRSAMPSVRAKRLCPDLIFVKGRFEVYRAVSAQIRDIFARFTPLIEPLSLDEAYLDLTDHLEGRTATQIAREIRALIRAETGLTASAGVSYNKFLAKLASDHRKPNGQYVISPEMGPAFVETLPVGKFHGIGPAKAKEITGKLNITPERRVQDLTDQEVLQIRETIDADHTVEGDLRRETAMNIKRLMDLACYRGLRHRKGLPVRGQRTHTNARTRKGKAKPIAGKKK